ncbi:hypothetical protein N7532_004851 [Penicillium argentinense]|uniref:Uncharacterized protein n=1 Tax=Penicillium argentinense TaxID=1131581 RepID=A0A9W9FCS1_9EURO|nr:uncharacterized protein N7532_004851 [Penicillium argentinense]KAJ5097850.1 hypothetical protein N7532_004851 [Penicillium argentinense]
MHGSLSLQVTLASQMTTLQASPALAVPITISVHNPADAPMTLLRWNSPLDLSAGLLGVFEVCDTGTGQAVPVDTIKISRKLPASLEDLVEIPAGQTVNQTVNLPEIQLEEGHEYSIRAQGIWHAVWDMPLADVTASQLNDLTGSTRGQFQSNIAVVKVE